MWRIFNGIPRAIRQHVHGPRAATGICKEEEQHVEHELDRVDSCSWFERSRRCVSSPPESKGDKGEGQGTDRDNDWWNNIHRDWFPFCGRHTALEAVTWGAAVVLGIQLSRPRWSDGCIRSPPSSKGLPPRRPSLLFQVAFALPGKTTTAQSVKQTRARQLDTTDQPGKEDGALSDVLKDFEDICKKYTALGKSVLGLRFAQEGDMSEAVKHMEESSRLGHASAQFNLGLCFEMGKGVEVDLKKAAEYYRMAGEDGHAKALYNLALLHLKGEGGMKKDTPTAMLLLEQAAQSGLTEAQTYMGVYYTEEEQQDMKKAVKFFTQAAEQHDPEAQYFLAICYEQGWGVEVNECKAAHLYSMSAQSGHDGAMYNLAVFHEHGLGGIPKDGISALHLYKKAAAQGNESAKFKLQEWQAQAAVWEWKAENDDLEASGGNNSLRPPKILLNPSKSSPSVTEYVRQNIGELCIGAVRPASEPVFPPQHIIVTSPEGRSKSEQVLFYLRPEEVDKSDDADSGYGSPPALTPNSSGVGLHRNATMPDLRTWECA
ncbi:uncharacterized protein [Haliotis cracherodii]|uniref:uncharacterized protein n=1 Tax=Haliotis cracherodii TaxID=6455 RepID=UPI0039E969D9